MKAIVEGNSKAVEMLKSGQEATNETVKELQKLIDANKTAIDNLIKSGIDKDKFNELLAEMGLNIADLSSNLSSLVYYPEAYVNGVEAVVFSPIVFRAETEKNITIRRM